MGLSSQGRRRFETITKRLILLGPLLAAVFLAGLLLRDELIRKSLERRILAGTGMEAHIGSVRAGLFSPVFTLKDFKLFNTAEFGRRPFLAVPQARVELDPAGLRERKLRVNSLRLNLEELDVVRNAAGKTNLVAMLGAIQSPNQSLSDLLHGFEFKGIQELSLTLGRARFTDLQDGRNDRCVEINLQNQLFKNVRSEADLRAIGVMLWLRSGGNFTLGGWSR